METSTTLLTFVLTIALVIGQANANSIRLSEPVAQDENSETFGAIIDQNLPTLTMAKLVNDSENLLATPFQVQARIAKVCQKKGCFFIAQQGQDILRVSFRDYGFFIPTDSSGKTVTIAGELIQKTISHQQAEHFKADLQSDTELVKAGVVYEIVADSVKIPRT